MNHPLETSKLSSTRGTLARSLFCLLAFLWISGGCFRANAAAFDWNTYNGQQVKWENNVVPYAFDPTNDATHRMPTKTEQETFERAIRGWQKAANIKFVKRTNEADYIYVSASKSLFWGKVEPNFAWIGRSGGAQPMWLFNWNENTILHEMGHALGLTHEHQRSDRDSYVDCWWWNAEPFTQVNFVVTGNSDNRTAYDMYSIMHYVPYAFSKDVKNNLLTLHPKDESFLDIIGTNNWFSDDGEIPANGIPYGINEEDEDYKRVGTYGYLSPLDRVGIADEYGAPGKVSGTITKNVGGVLPDVTIQLKGVGNTVDTVSRMKLVKEWPILSDSAGSFEFIGLPAGSYTVKPVMAGYRFSPATQTVQVTSGYMSATSFSAILDEVAPPIVAFVTPSSGTPAFKTLTAASGIASDGLGGSGVNNVGLAISNSSEQFLNWSTGAFDSTSFSAAHRSVITNSSSSIVINWNFTIPANVTLPDGWYQFHVNAVDNSGNDSEYSTHSFYIDNGAPSVAFAPLVDEQNVLDFNLVGGTVSDTLSPVTTQISITEDNGGNGADRYWNGNGWVSVAQMLYGRVDGNNWKPAFALPTRAQISERGFYIYVKATDKAGNFNGATIHIHRIPTDSTVPDLSITSPTSNQVLSTNSIGPISGVARDLQTGLSEVTIYLMRLKTGGGGFETWNGTAWTDTQNPLPVALDHATGNWTAPATSSEFSYSLPSGANLRNGQYQLQAYAKNNETPGGTRGVSVSFSIDYHQEYTWTGATMRDEIPGGDYYWGNTGNWSPAGVPDANDIAFIGNGDTVRSTVSRTVHGFYLSSGTLDFDNATDSLNVTKTGSWTGGTLNDIVNINAGAAFSVSTINRKTLGSGATLNNSGTINWAAGPDNEGGAIHTYAYQTYERSTINNGGIFNLTTDGTPFTREYRLSLFNNLAGGKLIKTGGAGTATIDAFELANSGEVRTNSGVLAYNTTINALAGSTFTRTGTGAHLMTAGNFNLNGNSTISGTPFTVAGGTISGTGGTLTTLGTGAFNWTGGSLDGIFNFAANSTMNLSGSGVKIIASGATLNNSGTINWAAGPNNAGGDIHTYAYQTHERSTINNRSGANFNVTTGGTVFTKDYRPSLFNNEVGAKFNKTGAGVSSANDFEFNNKGLARVFAGSYAWNAGGNSTGVFQADSGAILRLTGGINAVAGTQLTGAGRVQIDGATVTGNGAFTNSLSSPGGLDLISGTLDGTTNYSGAGLLNWSGGSLGGTFTLAAGSTINVLGAAQKTLVSSATLNNNGTINWAAGPNNVGGSIYTYAYQLAERSTINNRSGANFNLTTDGTPFSRDHQYSLFNNLAGGKLNKTGGAGSTVINAFAVDNAGEVRSNSGVLDFGSPFDVTGPTTLAGTAKIRLSDVATASAAITANCPVELTGSLTGKTHPTTGAPLSSYSGPGVLSWKSGTLRGVWTLNAGATMSISGAETKILNSGATLNNNGTINWAGGPNNTGNIHTYAYQLGERSTINNRNGGVFNITTDGTPFTREHQRSFFNNLAGGKLIKTGGAGTATVDAFELANSGEVRSNSGVLAYNTVLNANNGGTFTGAGKHLMTDGAFNVRGTTTLNGPVFEIGGGTVAGDEATSGTLAGLGSGLWNWTGGTVSGALRIGANTNLVINGAARKTLASGATLDNFGIVSFSGGDIYTYAYQETERSTVTNRSGATFKLMGGTWTYDYKRSFFQNNGTIEVAAPLGVQLGKATLERDFAQSSIGRLNIQLGGVNAATPQFDQLNVGGSVSLAGAINVSFVNGYFPAPGASFKVLSGARTGTFGATNPAFETIYNANDVTLIFDRTPPNIAITSPANGSVIQTLPSISGTASDAGSSLNYVSLVIQRKSDGKFWTGTAWGAGTALTTTKTGNTWKRNTGLPAGVNLLDGNYLLSAFAYDYAKNFRRADSNISKHAADSVAPTISIGGPANGAVVQTLTAIGGITADNVGVTRVDLFLKRNADGKYWNGSAWTGPTAIATAISNGTPRIWSRTTGLPAGANLTQGSYFIAARAYDAANNGTSATATFTVASGDTTPPTISIGGPANGAVVQTLTAIGGVTADNVGVTRVDLFLKRNSDGKYWNGSAWTGPTAIATAISNGTPRIWSRTTGLPAGANLTQGSYFIAARAYDAANNGTSATATFTVASGDTTPPTVAIASPTNGSTVSGFAAINGTTNDTGGAGIERVVFYLQRKSDNKWWNGSAWIAGVTENTATLGTAAAWNASTNLPQTTNLVDGLYTLGVVSFDRAGNSGNTSATFTLKRTAAVAETPKASSPVQLSSASAKSDGTIRLNFTGALKANATDATRYIVAQNGAALDVQSVQQPSASEVVVTLETLTGGARVAVTYDLQDTQGRTIKGTANAIVR